MKNLISTFSIVFLAILSHPALAKPLRQNSSLLAQTVLKQTAPKIANWELRTAPIAFFAKWITLDVSYAVSDKFAFGPSAIFYSSPKGEPGGMIAPAYNGYAAGVNAMYYFGSIMRRTWYSSAHLYYEDFTAYGHGIRNGEFTESTGFKGNAAVGYRWRWSRITMLVGGGAEYRNHSENEVRLEANNQVTNMSGNTSDIVPFLEFKVGILL